MSDLKTATWNTVHLGTIFRLETKSIFPAAYPGHEFLHHSLPAYDEMGGPNRELGGNIESNKTVIRRPSILVSKLNPRIPRVSLVETISPNDIHCASTEFMVYEPVSSIVYLGYFHKVFLSAEFQRRLTTTATGTTGSHTRARPKETLRWEVEVPPLAEQRRIAEILDTADVTIRSTERLIAKLGQAKQALLHDLLTRGIDECGELRDPRSHPDRFLETPIGLFPRAWTMALLGEVVSKGEYGISLPLAYGSGIPVLRMNNLHSGEVVLQDIKSCSLPIPSRLFLKPGDILFNRTNSMDHVGRTGIWRGGSGQFSFASYLVRLVHDPRVMVPQYLNMWLNCPKTQLSLRKYATPGVHQVNVNPPNLRRVPIAYPPSTTEQSAICERIEAADAELAQLRRELRQRLLLKRGLMDDLLRGRVRVGASA